MLASQAEKINEEMKINVRNLGVPIYIHNSTGVSSGVSLVKK